MFCHIWKNYLIWFTIIVSFLIETALQVMVNVTHNYIALKFYNKIVVLSYCESAICGFTYSQLKPTYTV
jgi:hypothetical protein